MPFVQLPDGTVKDYPADTTPLDIAEGISPRLAKACVAAQVNGTIVDLRRPLAEDTRRQAPRVSAADREGRRIAGGAAAFVRARHGAGGDARVSGDRPRVRSHHWTGLLLRLRPRRTIREEDFPRIEAEMQRIVQEAEPFDRFELPRDEAVAFVRDLNQELKAEHIATGLADHGSLSFYRQGEFVDLCRGPHIPDAGKIKAFKLLSIAGAHWKGDSAGKPLQRLYGTAFFSQKDLDAHMERLDEAKKRDHRVLGKQHGLFHISNEVGQGLCLWLPKGATVRNLLEDFIKAELLRRGYQPVYTPHIGRVEMYETSGHFPYYRDSQFAPLFVTPPDRSSTAGSPSSPTAR